MKKMKKMKTTGLFVIVFLMMSVPAFSDLALFLGSQDPGVVTLNSVPDAGGAILKS
jgi:hypothetical protein